MRNLDDQQFEEVFRQNLEPDYTKFEEAAWEEMEQRLNGVRPPKVGTSINYAAVLQYGTIAVLIAVSAAGFWQTNQNQKAINQLSTQLDELKNAGSAEMTAVAKENIASESGTDTRREATYEVVTPTAKPVTQVAQPTVEPLLAEKSTYKGTEQKDDSEPLMAKAKSGKDHPGAEESFSKQAKYYILVDGEFIPVAEFDHPGADQGDSVKMNSLEAMESN